MKGLVEGGLGVYATAQLLSNLVLIVGKGANPIGGIGPGLISLRLSCSETQTLCGGTDLFGLHFIGMALQGAAICRHGSAPPVTDEPLHLIRTNKLREG
mmetsp:Transcript_37836/g.46883  ORF Transcript_37836/g.46883 Transcript_37836/m.46883 type:complete len:99 (-) Transcript_37836:810-1106(-)